jgi:hypothetical protein
MGERKRRRQKPPARFLPSGGVAAKPRTVGSRGDAGRVGLPARPVREGEDFGEPMTRSLPRLQFSRQPHAGRDALPKATRHRAASGTQPAHPFGARMSASAGCEHDLLAKLRQSA